MEFNEQYYNKLIKLLVSPKKEAASEIRKIVQDVTAYYVANGISELWQNLPGDDVIRQDAPGEVITTRLHGQIKGAPSGLIKKDLLSPIDSATGQHLHRASPNRANASSPNVYAVAVGGGGNEKRNSKEFSAIDSIVGENSLDSESIRFVPNVNADDDADQLNLIKFEDNESVVVPGLIVSQQQQGIKRSLSDNDDDPNVYGDIPPPSKVKKIEEDSASKVIREKTISTPKPDPVSFPTFSPQSSVDEPSSAILCTVCKQFSIPIGNRLLECHDCHNMYHQKCHEPNIPQSQMDDPRSLWYCSACSKKQKKPTLTNASKSVIHSPSSKQNAYKDAGKDKTKTTDSLQKRTEFKEKTAQILPIPPSPSQQKPVASLAADFFAKHKSKVVLPQPKINPTPLPLPSTFVATNYVSAVASSAAGLVGLGKLAAAPPQKLGGMSTVPGLNKLQQMPLPSKSPLSGVLQSPSATGGSSSNNNNLSQLNATKSSSSSTSKLPSTSTSMLAAEKRLQQMKKKAASKSSFMK